MYLRIFPFGLIQYTWVNLLSGHRIKFPIKIVFLSLKIAFVLAINVDPDVDPFHLGLHCLPKYLCRSHQYTKG